MKTPEEIALAFVEAVNQQDVPGMAALLDGEHRLTDSLGRSIEGREAVLAAWRAYFGWMPDYRIAIGDVLVRGSRVALFGTAFGTFAPDGEIRRENRWELPAAWLAEVAENLIESWQVYTDNKPVYEIMERHRAGRTDP
jgi:hypothetical protein